MVIIILGIFTTRLVI